MILTKKLINYNVSIEHVYLIYVVDLFFLLMFTCLQRLIVSTGIHFCLMDNERKNKSQEKWSQEADNSVSQQFCKEGAL